MVRADARLLVPDRAALAAAGRPLAAGARAPPLLAAGRCRRLGTDRAAATRRAGGAVRPGAARAPRPARQELGLRQPVRRLMSLLTPLITRNRSSTIPTELKRYIASSEMRLPRTFSASAQSTWPPSSGRNGNRLMTARMSDRK